MGLGISKNKSKGKKPIKENLQRYTNVRDLYIFKSPQNEKIKKSPQKEKSHCDIYDRKKDL